MRDDDWAEVLPDIPRMQAKVQPDNTAIWFAGHATSFRQLDMNSNRVANALLGSDVTPGARVAVYGKDSDRSIEVMLGIAKARAVAVPINWRLKPAEVAFVLRHSETKILLVDAEFLPGLSSILRETSEIQKVVVLSGSAAGEQSYCEWAGPASAADPLLSASPDEVAVQMYTSGTTGHPKGVQLAHRTFFAVVGNLRRAGDLWIGWSPKDIVLHCVPLYHIGGAWWAMTCLNAGGRLVMMDSFAAGRALGLVAKHRVTKGGFVPAMLHMLLADPSCAHTDFSSLEYVVYGGSPISSDLLQKAMKTFGCKFAQIYGLTETGNTAVCLRPEDHQGSIKRLRAAGRPYPGVSLRVVDLAKSEVARGQIGEILIQSPASMVGYWKDEVATGNVLIDGWIHTGDAGYIDDEGYLYVCDRIKDMIICGSENVYPAEVENVLCEHEAVAEVAVIGIPHEHWGEAIAAVVALRTGLSCSAGQLIIHARRKLADYKVPHRIEFVNQLPRNTSGKVLKTQLREAYWQGRERKVN
jgi:acyl-CoA synthetase (AMP-forming)/AMP-acid ligase II